MQKIFGYLSLLLIILNSCVNRSYVPTMYEPMLLSKKGEMRASYAQTTSTGKAQLAYALKENTALVINETFASGITNSELGISYFRNRKTSYFEFGGGAGYQANYINYNYRPGAGIWFFSNRYYMENFNCQYGSMFVSGCMLWGEATKIGFGFKGGSLYIYHYDYTIDIDPYLGKEHPYPLDHEQFKFDKAFTIIAEPSLFLVKNTTNKVSFRAQLGYTYCSGAYEHNYYFQQNWSPTPILSGSKIHPDFKSVTLSVGITFKLFKDKGIENKELIQP